MLATGYSLLLSMLQLREFLQLHRVAQAEQGDDDGEADRHLGGRHGDDEEHEDVAIHRAVEAREGHCGQGRGAEHQLQAQVNDQRVPAQQNAKEPDGEEQCAEQQVVIDADFRRQRRNG